ncbi:MAG: hypothetical protein AB7Q17_11095 [Phycisphaerae bacterium]
MSPTRSGVRADVLAMLSLVVATATAQPRYHITPLHNAEILFGPTADLNERNQVVGWGSLRSTPSTQGLRATPGAGIDLIPSVIPGFAAASPKAINDLGEVAGQAQNGFGSVAFYWSEATSTVQLEYPPAESLSSSAQDINNLGQIVGAATSTDELGTFAQAMLWNPPYSQPFGLGDLPGGDRFSHANAINNHGVVVGQSTTFRGGEAFVWSKDDGMQALPDAPDGLWAASAHDINDLGQIVGQTTGGLPFFYDPEEGFHILPPIKDITDYGLYAINSRGQAVGEGWYLSRFQPPPSHAVIWDWEFGARDLNDFLSPVTPLPPGSHGNYLAIAWSINDQGRIAAVDRGANGYLLTPYSPCDVNCDGVVDVFDIDAFVEVLSAPASVIDSQWRCPSTSAADANMDGVVDNRDIDPFLRAVLRGG